eukprot:437796-Rhodomonas_salina.2
MLFRSGRTPVHCYTTPSPSPLQTQSLAFICCLPGNEVSGAASQHETLKLCNLKADPKSLSRSGINNRCVGTRPRSFGSSLKSTVSRCGLALHSHAAQRASHGPSPALWPRQRNPSLSPGFISLLPGRVAPCCPRSSVHVVHVGISTRSGQPI